MDVSGGNKSRAIIAFPGRDCYVSVQDHFGSYLQARKLPQQKVEAKVKPP